MPPAPIATPDPAALLAHADAGTPWPLDAAGSAWFTDLGAAYQAQLAVRALRIARGEQPRGLKLGFTNRTIWPRYGVWAPIWGTVWAGGLVMAGQGEGRLSLARTCEPRLEPELVFGLRATPAAATPEAVFDALDWLATGFELVHSHRAGWRFAAPDAVADGSLHARLLVGRQQPVRALAPDAAALHDLLAAGRVTLWRDGVQQDAGQGANVLDSPLMALVHAVAELAACPGAPPLQPGDLVTTGTWTDAHAVAPGQHWEARFDAPLPPVAVRFEA